MITRIAVIDDWMQAAPGCADWSSLAGKAEVVFFARPFASEDAAAAALQSFDIIVPMRERLAFPASLLQRLPRLRMLALTGFHAPHVDLDCCASRGIVVCGSGVYTPTSTAELALALMLAAARQIPAGDAAMRSGLFQEGQVLGETLEGRTLGIVGLGRIGTRLAAYGAALGMKVIAWSPRLTVERAVEGGARLASKAELFAESDIVSLHLMYSASTHHIVGAAELAAMRANALLVNTARSRLVDREALLEALHANRLRAALDVFDEEPVVPGDPILSAPNTVLTPHIGFSSRPGFLSFYEQSLENIVAFMEGCPIRTLAQA